MYKDTSDFRKKFGYRWLLLGLGQWEGQRLKAALGIINIANLSRDSRTNSQANSPITGLKRSQG